MKKTFNGKKLKTARVYRGKTIDMVASETKINKKDLLAFEDNKYKPTLENEMKLSNNLNFPKEYFFSEDKLKVKVEATHIRPESKLTRVEDISYKERLIMINKIFSFIENYIKFPQMEINFDMNKNDDIEILAENLRKKFNLLNEPVVNLLNILEHNGFIINDLNVNKKNALCFSQKQSSEKSTRYFISLGNDKKDLPTRNFDLAYELGFVISTELSIQSKKFSKEEFALAFLLPKNEFTNDFSNINELNDCLTLKRKWIVPVWAIIMRAYNLGLITYKKYNYLINEYEKQGFSKKEPIEAKASSPILMKKSIDLILDVMSGDKFVELLGECGLNIYKSEIENLFSLKEGLLGKHNNNVVNFKKSK